MDIGMGNDILFQLKISDLASYYDERVGDGVGFGHGWDDLTKDEQYDIADLVRKRLASETCFTYMAHWGAVSWAFMDAYRNVFDEAIDNFYGFPTRFPDMVDITDTGGKDNGLLGYGNDVLYRLGISTDLKPYYDSIKGDGAWDKLPEDVRYDIARSSERGLEGIIDDPTVVFRIAIDDAIENNEGGKL